MRTESGLSVSIPRPLGHYRACSFTLGGALLGFIPLAPQSRGLCLVMSTDVGEFLVGV